VAWIKKLEEWQAIPQETLISMDSFLPQINRKQGRKQREPIAPLLILVDQELTKLDCWVEMQGLPKGKVFSFDYSL
jgi:hypothetical protein